MIYSAYYQICVLLPPFREGGAIFGLINFEAFGVFSANLSAPILIFDTVSPFSMFSSIQPIFLQKNKPLDLNPKVTDIEPIFEYINKYGSRFPSTGLILGIYLGPGSRVRIQVPEYRSRFPSTVMGWLNIGDSYGMYIFI